MLLSLYFQGSLHLNVLKRSIPKDREDGAGSTAPPKARAREGRIQSHFKSWRRCLASVETRCVPSDQTGYRVFGHAESDSGTARNSFSLLECAMQRAECIMLFDAFILRVQLLSLRAFT